MLRDGVLTADMIDDLFGVVEEVFVREKDLAES